MLHDLASSQCPAGRDGQVQRPTRREANISTECVGRVGFEPTTCQVEFGCLLAFADVRTSECFRRSTA